MYRLPLALITLLALSGPVMATPTGTASGTATNTNSAQADPRLQRISALLARAPTLAAELQQLHADGLLKTLNILPPEQPLQIAGRDRSAALVEGYILLTPGLLDSLEENARRRHHANADFALLYVIAHQAGHAQAAQQAHLQALTERLTAQVHERGGDAVRADAGLLEAFATGMLEIEARATLVGWNHTLDAWLHHKGIACGPQENPDVSVQQVMAQTELLQQVPHARPLELAIGLDNGKALQMEAHGIALSEHNIAAVVTALRRMPQALDID